MFIQHPNNQRTDRWLRAISWFKAITIKAIGYKTTFSYCFGYLHSICISQFLTTNSQHHRCKISIPTKQRKTTEIFTGKPFRTPNPADRGYHFPNTGIIYIIPCQNTLHGIVAIVILTKPFFISCNKFLRLSLYKSSCFLQTHSLSATKCNRRIQRNNKLLAFFLQKFTFYICFYFNSPIAWCQNKTSSIYNQCITTFPKNFRNYCQSPSFFCFSQWCNQNHIFKSYGSTFHLQFVTTPIHCYFSIGSIKRMRPGLQYRRPFTSVTNSKFLHSAPIRINHVEINSKAIRKKHVSQYATSIPSIPPRSQFFL